MLPFYLSFYRCFKLHSNYKFKRIFFTQNYLILATLLSNTGAASQGLQLSYLSLQIQVGFVQDMVSFFSGSGLDPEPSAGVRIDNHSGSFWFYCLQNI